MAQMRLDANTHRLHVAAKQSVCSQSADNAVHTCNKSTSCVIHTRRCMPRCDGRRRTCAARSRCCCCSYSRRVVPMFCEAILIGGFHAGGFRICCRICALSCRLGCCAWTSAFLSLLLVDVRSMEICLLCGVAGGSMLALVLPVYCLLLLLICVGG